MLGPGWAVRDLTSLPDAPNVEETGATFAENAALKALAISRLFPGVVLADDSGLAVTRWVVAQGCVRLGLPARMPPMLRTDAN